MSLLPEGPIDTMGVRDAILATPEAVGAAAAAELDLPAPAGVHGTVLVASGADALVARAAAALAGPWSPVPLFVHEGHHVPAFVSDEWRCLFISRTPTAEAWSALRRATDHRAVVTAIGSGAIVETVAEHDGAVVRCTDEAPAARFSFAPTLVTALRVLDGLGAISTPIGGGGLRTALDATTHQLAKRRDELAGAGAMADLAREVDRTLLLAYGAGPLGAVAADRWKVQVNDNVKAGAFAASLPALTHHELSGWGQHGDMTRQVFSLVTLRHDHEDAADAAVFPEVDELMEEVVHRRHEVRGEGQGPHAQLFDLAFQGDLFSWHLAQRNEIDPGPTGVTLDEDRPRPSKEEPTT